MCNVGIAFNCSHQLACTATLLGAQFPLDGRALAENARQIGDTILIDDTQLSTILLRWADGIFSEAEVEFSILWRNVTRSFSFSSFGSLLRRHHVLVPRPENEDAIVDVADSLLDTPALQPIWLKWILEEVVPGEPVRNAIRGRFRAYDIRRVRDASPYAHQLPPNAVIGCCGSSASTSEVETN